MEKFYDEGVAYLNDYISSIDIWKRQELFLNCIKVIDKTFLDSITTAGDEKGQFFTDILHFAYPVLIEYVYTDEFEELPAAVLAKLTDDEKSARYVDTINLFNYGYDNYNLEEIKKEYPDTVEEVSSSDVEEKVDNLPEDIYQKLKPDNTKAIIMISVGFVVLIIGFVLLRRGKKK